MVTVKGMLLKTVRREIRQNAGRFIALFAITALGVGFLAGLLSTAPDLYHTVDTYYDRLNFMDLDIKSTGGLTDDDLQAVAEKDFVENVTPARVTDVMARIGDGDESAARIYGVDMAALSAEDETVINRVELSAGHYPQQENECLATVSNGIFTQISVGDRIALEPESNDIYAVRELTVVGLVKSAEYMSIEKESATIGNGRISMVLYACCEIYNTEYYTDLYVTFKDTKALNTFEDDYEQLRDSCKKKLGSVAKARQKARYAEILEAAGQKLTAPQQEFDSQKAETEARLTTAKKELDNAKIQIDSAQEEIEKNTAKLEDAKLQLELSAANVEMARSLTSAFDRFYTDYGALNTDSSPEDYTRVINQLNTAVAEAQKNYEVAKSETDKILNGRPGLSDLKNKTDAAAAQITQSLTALGKLLGRLGDDVSKADALAAAGGVMLTQIRAQVTQYDNAKAEYDSGIKQLENGKKQLAASQKKYESGLAEYENAKVQADTALAAAQQQLDDGQTAVSAIAQPKWYLLDRGSNVSFVSLSANAQKVDAIAKVFPVFFFLVAALVALTTMTRMVDEQRTEIGTLKALGYSNGAIAGKYLLYSGAASIVGGAFGLAVGLYVLPKVIINAYRIMYRLPPVMISFNPKISLLALLAAIICIAAATLVAVLGNLREVPARLMLPKAPKNGKRILLERWKFLWNRMKFTHKVTARNLFRYKKRFCMTVIGICGCTALLLTGFGLRDAIGDIVGKQYGDIQQYNLSVNLSGANARKEVLSYFEENSDGYFEVHTESGFVVDSDGDYATNLYVPSEISEFGDYMKLRDRKSGKQINFDENSVIVTEKFAANHHIKKGSDITLKNNAGNQATVTVTGICENYIYSYVYLSAEQYEKVYGTTGDFATLLVKSTATDEDAAMTEILAMEGVSSALFSSSVTESFKNMIDKINYIVYVLIISAGLLAFVVLYNLTNINISERQKEIATIKVLGFYDREVSAYIYRETYVLSMIGTLVGLFAGIFLCRFVVATAEVDVVMFGRTIYPLSFLLAAAITMSFTVLVSLVMSLKLKRIDMVESMKSVD